VPLTNEQAIAVIEEHLRSQDTQLHRIEGKVDKTNGRVTALEKARAVDEALARRERDAAAAMVEAAAEARTVRLSKAQMLAVALGSIAAMLAGIGGLVEIANHL
jgi:hypothetical protein